MHAKITKALARSRVYGFLSLGFSGPEPTLAHALRQQQPALEHALTQLENDAGLRAAKRLRPVLERLTPDALLAAHDECFGHTISKEYAPYEAEYGQAHIFQKTQQLADLAGFYRAFGLEIVAGLHERLDHISVELEFMQFLCAKEAHALGHGHAPERIGQTRTAQTMFLREHLGQWAPEFAGRLSTKGGGRLHIRLGELLDAFIRSELRRIGVEPAAIARPPVAAPAGDAPETASCWTPACGVAAESEAL